jgi:hypothetical protein
MVKQKKKKKKFQIEEIEDQPKVETKTEEKPEGDNLEQYTESVKKRIDKLTYKIREAERREKAALDFAKGLQKKYSVSLRKNLILLMKIT